MQILINIGIILATFVVMEFVAWSAHKFIMHGMLWVWHEDHHQPALKKGGFFEKNDLFFLVFAIPSAACYMLGSYYPDLRYLLYIGIGISIYGLVYFLIHDVYIHKRFKWFRHLNNRYSKAILKAHGAHHANQNKEGCVSFGLLWVDKKYFKRLTSLTKEKQVLKSS